MSLHSSWIQTTKAHYPKTLLIIGVMALAMAVSSCSDNRASGSASKATSKATITAEQAKSPKFALAQHLTKIGARLYGTYWCPFCARQEALFGDAIQQVQIVECDPKGENAQPEACATANVSSYPTWEINGKLYRGMRSLEELALLSGYQGSVDFGN